MLGKTGMSYGFISIAGGGRKKTLNPEGVKWIMQIQARNLFYTFYVLPRKL